MPSAFEDNAEKITINLPESSFEMYKVDHKPDLSIDISKEELIDMYTKMSTVRRMELTADNAYKSKLIRGFCHLSTGQVCCRLFEKCWGRCMLNYSDYAGSCRRRHGGCVDTPRQCYYRIPLSRQYVHPGCFPQEYLCRIDGSKGWYMQRQRWIYAHVLAILFRWSRYCWSAGMLVDFAENAVKLCAAHSTHAWKIGAFGSRTCIHSKIPGYSGCYFWFVRRRCSQSRSGFWGVQHGCLVEIALHICLRKQQVRYGYFWWASISVYEILHSRRLYSWFVTLFNSTSRYLNV